MADFILLYKGEATDLNEMSEAQAKAVMDGWKVCMEDVGGALKDVGAPMGEGLSLVDDGTTGKPLSLSGYSILTADSLEHAKKLSEKHPFLSEGKGAFAVEIYELTPIPMDM